MAVNWRNVAIVSAGVGASYLLYKYLKGDIGIPGRGKPPVPQFSISPTPPVEEMEELTFDASSSYDPDGSIRRYTWDMGDGTQLSGQVVTHSYQEEGTYAITLTVEDDDGNTRSTSRSILVERLIPGRAVIPLYPRNVSPVRSVSTTVRDELLAIIEPVVRGLPNFREGNYVLNMGGEVLPAAGPIGLNDLVDLANFISRGGVWIDYTDWPFYYGDVPYGTLPIFGNPKSFAIVFGEYLDIEELAPGFIIGEGAHFDTHDIDPSFIYERSLVLPGVIPPELTPNYYVSEDEYVYPKIFSSFVIKKGGYYFYANKNVDPAIYGRFITDVLTGNYRY